CAPSLKRLSMELGGNAPFVVFADADLDRAADELMANKFRCAGQTCVCANRVLVDAEVHDAFVERVVARVRALKVGPGAVAGTDVGPLVDERAWRKVDAMVGDAVASGARAVVGRTSEPPAMGWFYTPTVLVGVEPGMRCWEEELFGPVVSISRFTSEEQAFQLANDTEYGLAAYVFSADTDRLDRAAARLHFGHIGLNTSSGPTPEAPFGGMVQSGLGREGGLEGVLEFIELQTCPTRTG
ncbi:MAG: succinate-semialdehyde dehydrogenase/glutarate-semialdehyde dehydrogenase, partial [Myxococcota bacterium]